MPHPVMGLGLFFLGTAADFQFAVEVFQYLRAAEAGNQGLPSEEAIGVIPFSGPGEIESV